jgi:hypothetical protein
VVFATINPIAALGVSALRGVRHDHPDRRAWCFHQSHTAE